MRRRVWSDGLCQICMDKFCYSLLEVIYLEYFLKGNKYNCSYLRLISILSYRTFRYFSSSRLGLTFITWRVEELKYEVNFGKLLNWLFDFKCFVFKIRTRDRQQGRAALFPSALPCKITEQDAGQDRAKLSALLKFYHKAIFWTK
jgi:hypothetical protein